MVNCKFCGSTDQKTFIARERMFGKGDEFEYSECLSCGSLQILSVPENLSIYYSSSSYYSFSKLSKSSLVIKLLKRIRLNFYLRLGTKVFEPIYGYWLKKIKPKFTDRIADVGCGNGQLLYELFASGYSDLHGFDPYLEKDVEISPNLKLWKKPFEETDLQFDLIMLHHSFEHMPDPKSILKTCFDKLKSGGKLLIRTPVSDAHIWKEERENWVQLDAPRHLVIPSISGFKNVSEAIGFVLNDIEFDSSEFQFWGTELYKKGLSLDPRLVAKNFTKTEMTFFKKKALLYNQKGFGDQVCFYLSKP